MTFTDNGNGTATLAGTPAAGTGGTYALTFTATNGVGSPTVQNFTLTVNQAPAITSATGTTFTVGVAGTFTVTTTGFPTPVDHARGALPAGVTFTDNGNGTATLAGTPAAGTGGTYPLTLTATNGVGSPASQSFTLTVNQAPAITSADNTTFTVGRARHLHGDHHRVPDAGDRARRLALPAASRFTDNGNGTGHARRHARRRHRRDVRAHVHRDQRRPARPRPELHAHRQPGAGDHQRDSTTFTVGRAGHVHGHHHRVPGRRRSARTGALPAA